MEEIRHTLTNDKLDELYRQLDNFSSVIQAGKKFRNIFRH